MLAVLWLGEVEVPVAAPEGGPGCAALVVAVFVLGVVVFRWWLVAQHRHAVSE